MEDITKRLKEQGLETKAGERFYRMPTGHHFKVYGLKDEVASTHGSEVLRMFATEVDANGNELKRRDGSSSTDPHGHTIVRQAHDEVRRAVPEGESGIGEVISFRELILDSTRQYLEQRIRASDNHNELSELDDMFVDSSKADYIPPSLTHILDK